MLRVLKRIALLLLAFAAVAAGALYVLYVRRTPRPATAPHDRVAPSISSIPGLSACWIETGKTFSNFSFGATAGSVLVRHSAGDLLIDTGNSSHFEEEIRSFPFLTWLKLESLAAHVKAASPLPEILRLAGADPATFLCVTLSHY